MDYMSLKSELGHFGFGNKVCLDYLANQMRSKTMKITGQADILIVHLASSSPEVTLVTRQEKLTFDGKKSEATLFTGINKKSTVKWSDD